ncbi:MAG: uracil-DNA glycosylase [Bdellovibrionota bacterium]
MSDGLPPTLAEELREHLRLSGISGLPRSWFESHERAAHPAVPLTDDESIPLLHDTVLEEEHIAPARETEPVLDLPSTELPPSIANAGWDSLREQALGCIKCRLCEGRNKVVFGVGRTEQPGLVFVGEGPGADEDQTGEPFVGRAGALLTAAITKGMGLKREDVYICNVVKCRPPGNRAPLPDEVASCTPYLYRQLELLQPKVIVTLGQPAQLALSGVNMGITRLRGQWQNWRGIKLMPTFHPAYILRNPSAKRLFWEDLLAVMEVLGIPGPRPARTE